MEHFPRIHHVAALSLSHRSTEQIRRSTRTFHRKNSIYVDVQRHFLQKKDNEEECLANANVVSIFAKKFGIGQWSFIGPGSEKKWYSVEESSPQGILGSYRGKDAGGIRRKRMSNFPCNDSIVQG